MKRIIGIAVIVVLLVISLLSTITRAGPSIADISVPANELTSNVGETANSASATITITMTTAPLPDE